MDLPLLLLFSFSIVFANADECVQTSPCSCVFPNGTGIDLSPSARIHTSVVEESVSGDTIVRNICYFHPCFDVSIPKPIGIDVSEDLYTGNHSIWQDYRQNYSSSRSHMQYVAFGALGDAKDSHFAPNGSYIDYSNSHRVLMTYVYLVCADADDKVFVKYRPLQKHIDLHFHSKNACLRQLEPPVSNIEDNTRWTDLQWSDISQAIKDGYDYVAGGLSWLVQQPLEKNTSH